MKKILTFLFVLALVPIMQAQWVVESFDHAVGPTFFDPAELNVNYFTNGNTATPPSFFRLADTTVAYEGTGSMVLDYNVSAYDGWGGYVVRVSVNGTTQAGMPYLDLSSGTHLKLRYKILAPVVKSQTGTAFIEFKMAEYDDQGNRDLWLHHTTIDLSDVSGNWLECTMPLEQNANNELGFVAQFADGDGVLQLEHIKGFEVAIVYLTSGGPVSTPTAKGELLWDKLELTGNRYDPLETFDNAATGVFQIDSFTGSVNLTNNSSSFVEGAGSMQLNYMVNCSESWGGYINMKKTLVAPPDSFENRSALVLFIKNPTPYTGTNDRVTMRFFVSESSAGANEDWVCEVPIDLDQTSDWTRYYMPLDTAGYWFDSLGHQHFPQQGFAQPWWSLTGDLKFNPEQITSWKIELSGGGTDYGPINEQLSGTLLFDVLQQSGFKFADDIPPVAPGSIFIVPDVNKNLVTWADIDGEFGEKYNVYASLSPITDLTSPNVDLIAANVIEGQQFANHLLLSPNTSQSLKYYYAIVCKDLAGNIGAPGFGEADPNLARAVVTISEVVPVFVADGNLAEWQSIPHFRMYTSDGTASIAPNFTIDNDADCSADLWLAIDANYLYFATKVNDNVFFPVESGTASYLLDSPDLFIGLYDWKQAMHPTYQRGSHPDYHLRFNEGVARNDHSSSQCDSMLVEGANYYFGELFPTGYVVEAKIPLVDLATKRNGGNTGTDTISVGFGDRIPVDFGINDNDGTGREGLIFYSPINNDHGWEFPNLWSYTWISDWAVGVEEEGTLVNKFSLSQNYPNPFNPATIIKYSIAEPGLVTLKVYDVLGREVANLVNDFKSAGGYDVTFDASNLSSGVYMYKIESGSYKESKKMILIK